METPNFRWQAHEYSRGHWSICSDMAGKRGPFISNSRCHVGGWRGSCHFTTLITKLYRSRMQTIWIFCPWGGVNGRRRCQDIGALMHNIGNAPLVETFRISCRGEYAQALLLSSLETFRSEMFHFREIQFQELPTLGTFTYRMVQFLKCSTLKYSTLKYSTLETSNLINTQPSGPSIYMHSAISTDRNK